jgi:hypothetical protein
LRSADSAYVLSTALPLSFAIAHFLFALVFQDLTYITDGDVKGNAPPCCQMVLCCGKGRDELLLKTSSDGEKLLKLEKGQGETVSRKIMNQVEEAQRIERD